LDNGNCRDLDVTDVVEDAEDAESVIVQLESKNLGKRGVVNIFGELLFYLLYVTNFAKLHFTPYGDVFYLLRPLSSVC
jgi:hypothetical protein